MKRQYFIAVVAPGVVNEQVLQWKNMMLERFGCRVALRSPAHITLVPPFFLAPDQEKNLLQVLQYHCSNWQPFEITLHNFDAFKPRVIFVNVEKNEALASAKAKLEDFLIEKEYPIHKETRPFHPHVTLANRDLAKSDFPAAWEYFQGIQYHTTFVATGATLLRSGKDGWEILHAGL